MSHPDEHLLIFEPDHAERALDLLLWQDRGKPRYEALVRAFAAGAQALEHLCWAVIIGASTVQGAEGVNLDRWGALVGEIRGGLDDEQYRLFISLRIRVNTLFQNEDNVWQLIADAVAPYDVVAHPMLPAGKQFLVHSTDWLPEPVRAHLGALVRDFRPMGINVPVVETVPEAMAFEWDGSGGTVITSGTGTAVVSRLIYSGHGRP